MNDLQVTLNTELDEMKGQLQLMKKNDIVKSRENLISISKSVNTLKTEVEKCLVEIPNKTSINAEESLNNVAKRVSKLERLVTEEDKVEKENNEFCKRSNCKVKGSGSNSDSSEEIIQVFKRKRGGGASRRMFKAVLTERRNVEVNDTSPSLFTSFTGYQPYFNYNNQGRGRGQKRRNNQRGNGPNRR